MVAISAKKFFEPDVSVTPGQEQDFFKSIQLSNRVFKTTGDRRMEDLNALVVDQWTKLGARPREILDVGASSGISSAEWIDSLTAAKFDVRMVASDLSLFGELVSLTRRHEVLVDASGEILQHVVFNLPLRPWNRRLDYFTGLWLLRVGANALARARMKRRAMRGQPIMLVSARARDHARITFAEDDVLQSAPEGFRRRFDAVRAANILNRDYFTPAELGRAVANLRERMTGAGAFLIVGRTLKSGTNHATLFRLNEAHRFDIVARLGGGSEIEDIVVASAARAIAPIGMN